MPGPADPTAGEIWADPSWVPYALDNNQKRMQFVRMPSEQLRAAPFLDDRALTPDMPRTMLPVAEIAAAMPAAMPPPPAIFHSAFCCSTLLARALDRPGVCLALKEPAILMALANAKRMMGCQGGNTADYQRLFEIVTTLVGRQHRAGERVLVKPTNAANNLLPDWQAAEVPVVLIHAALEDFLVSVLKKGEACKSFMRTQYNVFALDGTGLSRIPPRQAMTFTDLQVSTLVWRHQLEGFFVAKRRGAQDLLDVTFLAAPERELLRVAGALGLPHTKEDIAATLREGVLGRDVKDENRALDAGSRAVAASKIREQNADALSQIKGWAAQLRLDGEVLRGALTEGVAAKGQPTA